MFIFKQRFRSVVIVAAETPFYFSVYAAIFNLNYFLLSLKSKQNELAKGLIYTLVVNLGDSTLR